jgi:hypothetical protein
MTTKILSVLLIGFYTLIPSVQAQNDEFSFNRGNAVQTNYYVRIPCQIFNKKFIVEVIMNGKLRKFIIDTGAPLTISEELCDEMKFPILNNVILSDANGIESTDSVKVVLTSDINIGGIIFNDIPALVENMEGFSCLGVDGVIGSNLLRNSIIQFNLNEKTIVLADNIPNNSFLDKGVSTQIQLDSTSKPIITIALFDEEAKIYATHEVLFDTGDDDFYTVSLRDYNFFEEKLTGFFKKYAEAEGANSITYNGVVDQYHYLLKIPELSVNGVSFKNVVAQTTHDSASRIGSSVLDAGTVTLDYINKVFYFCSVVYMPTEMLTVEPVIKNGKLVVGIIWDKSLEDKINAGDEILKIDDTDYSSYDLCDFYKNSHGRTLTGAETVVLKDVNTGEQKVVKLNLTK